MKRRKILVVDDELDITLAITRVLEESGSKVDSHNDPVLALQNFKANFYDLIIHIKMPKMNGFDLCEKIIKIDGKVKVCFLTAWGEFRDYELKRKRNTLCKEGKVQLIQNPIENEKLIELIDTVM